jgi:hypothetical protein
MLYDGILKIIIITIFIILFILIIIIVFLIALFFYQKEHIFRYFHLDNFSDGNVDIDQNDLLFYYTQDGSDNYFNYLELRERL